MSADEFRKELEELDNRQKNYEKDIFSHLNLQSLIKRAFERIYSSFQPYFPLEFPLRGFLRESFCQLSFSKVSRSFTQLRLLSFAA